MDPPRLHVLVPDAAADAPGFRQTAASLRRLGGGRLALHLRLREGTDRRLHELAAALSREAREHGGWCVVNGRSDVARTAGAQAVQLGAGALPPADARAVVGESVALGVSVHGPREAARAARDGANYLLVGTIFPSASHPGRPGAGPARVAACRDAGAPVVAVGGVTPKRVPAVLGAGAHGVAVLGGVWSAGDPLQAAARYLDALPGRRPDG